MSEDDGTLSGLADRWTTPVNAPNQYDVILLVVPLSLVGGAVLWAGLGVSFRLAASLSSALASVVILHGLVGSPPVGDD